MWEYEERGGLGGDGEKIGEGVGFQTDSCSGLTRGNGRGLCQGETDGLGI